MAPTGTASLEHLWNLPESIPPGRVDSRLVGHVKGSFTGAVADAEGVFEAAQGGTLFLDEIGELPVDAQVRLLRTLQENEVVRIGENHPRPIDVRVVAATHVDLFGAVAAGDFRQDLAYRLAVGIVRLPPLRERGNDLHLLVDRLLDEVNEELADQPDFPMCGKLLAVETDDTGGFLPAMLQGVQTERGKGAGFRMPEDSEDTAFLVQFIVVQRIGSGNAGMR